MTDDEALTRRVVDGRGDDLPRLVYADWLDDRGDPRGAYLRAELAWAERRPADPAGEGLRELAAGLDPVWVARVTRTPAGVCADHVRWDCMGFPPGPPLTADDLQPFEDGYGPRLPAEYQAFLLNRNGGRPYPNKVLLGADPGDYEPTAVAEFVPLGPAVEAPDGGPPVPTVDAVQDPFGTETWLIAVAADGGDGAFYVGNEGHTDGRVFYHSGRDPWDGVAVRDVADSLGQFLDRLIATEPGWARMVILGNTAGVARWLAAGGDPNAVDPATGWTPLMYAVDRGRADVLDWLLARGARPTPDLRQLNGYADPAVGRRVDAALRGRR